MQKFLLSIACLAALAVTQVPRRVEAITPYRNSWKAARHAATRPWHANYYHTSYGMPLALVVPPTATTQTKWGWGVAQSEVTPIYHQYGRAYMGRVEGAGEMPMYFTPHWPSHTDQFGVYYVRGPW